MIEDFYKMARFTFSKLRLDGKLDREDAMQEAVLRCWVVRDRFDESRGKWATYFFFACKYAMLSMHRKSLRQKRSAKVLSLHAKEGFDGFAIDRCNRLEFIRNTPVSRKDVQEWRRAEILRLNAQGWNNLRVAQATACDPATVRCYLSRNGRKSIRPARPKGAEKVKRVRPKRRRNIKLDGAEIRRLVELGHEQRDIAVLMGCSPSTIRRRLFQEVRDA